MFSNFMAAYSNFEKRTHWHDHMALVNNLKDIDIATLRSIKANFIY